jgi:hypothetical protein
VGGWQKDGAGSKSGGGQAPQGCAPPAANSGQGGPAAAHTPTHCKKPRSQLVHQWPHAGVYAWGGSGIRLSDAACQGSLTPKRPGTPAKQVRASKRKRPKHNKGDSDGTTRHHRAPKQACVWQGYDQGVGCSCLDVGWRAGGRRGCCLRSDSCPLATLSNRSAALGYCLHESHRGGG